MTEGESIQERRDCLCVTVCSSFSYHIRRPFLRADTAPSSTPLSPSGSGEDVRKLDVLLFSCIFCVEMRSDSVFSERTRSIPSLPPSLVPFCC